MLDVEQRVDQHHSLHALRHPSRGLKHHRAPHGVTDEHDLTGVHGLDHGVHVRAEGGDRPLSALAA